MLIHNVTVRHMHLMKTNFTDVYYEPKRFTIADIVPSIEDGAGYIRKYEITKI